MQCNCFDTVMENVTEKVKQQLPKHDPDTLRLRWEHSMFRLDNSKIQVMLPISITYRKEKVNGEPYKNFTNDSINIAPSFCPFCGKPAREEEG